LQKTGLETGDGKPAEIFLADDEKRKVFP